MNAKVTSSCRNEKAELQTASAFDDLYFEMFYFCQMQQPSKDPMHGVTLLKMLEQLEGFYGFDTLAELIKIKCFTDNPSIKSSLTFLRKTPWARQKVEDLYIRTLPKF